MIKAPRGHTSIYLSDYLKSNFPILQKIIQEKGFTSFNGFCNYILVESMNNHSISDGKPKLSIFTDNNEMFSEKLRKYTDGELYDMYVTVNDKKNLMFKEMKKRGIGI